MSGAADNDPLIGRVLDGKFTLQSVLGRGGMGVVYRAHQKTLERPVALKLMRGFGSGDADEEREAEFQRRFFLEAATAAKLKHPNTITVFDYGSTTLDGEKVFYITMELLDGITLSKLLQTHGPLPPLRAVNIGLQICRSLREAHAAGIVHRDLKPGNVMLARHDAGDDDDGDGDFVKVLDFGLAKSKAGGSNPALGAQLTKAGTFLGSPRYVAPEQIEGKPVDGRADIYSFGCVMYRMLTGRVPFDGQQAVEVMLKHLHDPVPPMSRDGVVVPEVLEQLVLKCLQKKPDARPASMDEVITALKRARGEIAGVLSGNTAIPEELRERLRRELASAPLVSGPHPVPPEQPKAKEATSPSRASPKKEASTKEATSPSQSSPSQSSPSSSRGSQPSRPPGPSSSALSSSGEWKLGDTALEESTRPTYAGGKLTVVPRRRRTGGAVAAAIVLAVLVVGVGVVAQRGQLDPLIAALRGAPAISPPVGAGPRATAAASARLRIKTTPVGADVFDVSDGTPRLLGITPLTVPWEIAVGDPGRTLLLKLPGYVPARATVDPPAPSPTGEPVTLDVDATLRPLPAR